MDVAPTHAYKNVATVDDLDHDRDHSSDHDESSTEVGDSLIGEDEKQWDNIDLEDARSRHRRTAGERIAAALAAARSHRWLIDTLLLVVILGLLLLLHARGRPHASWQVGGDYTGEGPHCRWQSRRATNTFCIQTNRSSHDKDRQVGGGRVVCAF